MLELGSQRFWWRTRALLVFGVVGMTSYTLVGAASVSSRSASPRAQPTANRPIPNPYGSSTGANLVAFVITASDCGWSRQPEVLAAVRKLPDALRNHHGDRFRSISIIAVLIDSDLELGLRFFKEVSGNHQIFDQVSIGGGWLNEEAIRLMWSRHSVLPASPQIVLMSRQVDASEYLSNSRIRVTGDSILAEVSGSRQIAEWIRNGTPLPDSTGAIR